MTNNSQSRTEKTSGPLSNLPPRPPVMSTYGKALESQVESLQQLNESKASRLSSKPSKA